jgi:hypothetical protein
MRSARRPPVSAWLSGSSTVAAIASPTAPSCSSQHVELGVATRLLAEAPERLGYLLKGPGDRAR